MQHIPSVESFHERRNMNNNANTIIIGAGRMGSSIARLLNEENNVMLVDKNRMKLQNVLDFSGYLEAGDATDLTFLEQCGIANARRVIIITDDDNTNIYLADICCYLYGVEDIYVRLKDSRKSKIVDPRVKCICQFDLLLEDFIKQSGRDYK